jgi:hypothetical protein
VTLPKPVSADVVLKGDKPAHVNGMLVSYDDTQFTLKVAKEERTIAWRDITPTSAFALRQKVVDKNSAADWLALGRFGWQLGAKEQAQTALKTAVKLDASLKEDADKILASTPGIEALPADTAPTPPKPGDTAPPAQPGRKAGGKVERVKYAAATAEEAAAAIKQSQENSADVQKQLGLTFATIETDHFLIFTDWDPREHAFLKKNLEEAYRVVSKQFDMSVKDNIFVGKLPVYMFAKFRDFQRFARKFDSFPVENTVAGYYHGSSDGMGHMAMWKPDDSLTGGSGLNPEKLWGYVLVHEFTHAFLARYHTNEFIPRWLNEGIAEVIASSEITLPNRRGMAREAAQRGTDIMFLFDDNNIPDGNFYPVMQTMVEMLVRNDRKLFIKYVDAIKDGTDPEEALKSIYKTDYAGLAKAWSDYAKKLTN